MSFPLITITTSLPFCDAAGGPFTGEIVVTPTSPFRMPNGGQAMQKAVIRPLVAGLLKGTLQLANPALTSPTGIGYTFVAQDLAGNKATWTNVLIAPDVNGNFDLAVLNTGQFITAVPVTVLSVAGSSQATGTSVTAGAAVVSQYSVVALVGGVAVTATSSDPTQAGAVIGVAQQSAQPGTSFSVQSTGSISNAGWNFVPGPVFLSPSGALTQTAPSSGFVQILGTAVDPQTVLLSLQEPLPYPS